MIRLNWSDIIGHEGNVRALQVMLARRRVPHALLFTGPSGVGKWAVAQITAAGFLCDCPTEPPCGVCDSCRLYQREAHPDFLRIEPDGAAIKIDQIRKLQHGAALAPVRGQQRVCVIDDAELMTTQAANSLLKLLEEPPPGFLFILVAQDSRPLLPTILSRCCRLPFSPLAYELLSQTLVARGIEPGAAAVAARLSGGRLGKAWEILQPTGLQIRDQAMELFSRLSDNSGLIQWRDVVDVERLTAKDAAVLLQYLLGLLRDLLVLGSGHDRQLIFSQDLFAKLADLAPVWGEKQLLQAMDNVGGTLRAVRGNANVRLALEALWIRLNDLAKHRKEGDYGSVC